MNVKDMPVHIKAGPNDGLAEGTFTAYASVFGNKDSHGDVVMPGAFADDLARWKESGNPIPLLFGHNMSDPDFNIGHVVEATEDDKGLLVTAQLDLENPKAAQVYRMLKGKRINQMSFAYDVLEGGEAEATAADGQKDQYYELRKLKVYEISVVTIGANQETEVLAVKAGTEALAAGIKAGRVLSAKNEGLVRDAHAALTSVLSVFDAGSDDDQEKASGSPEAKSSATDEEPPRAKSSASDEEPKASPSARDLAAKQFDIYPAAWSAENGA